MGSDALSSLFEAGGLQARGYPMPVDEEMGFGMGGYSDFLWGRRDSIEKLLHNERVRS